MSVPIDGLAITLTLTLILTITLTQLASSAYRSFTAAALPLSTATMTFPNGCFQCILLH